ncbi:TPA: CopG family transcriptional regulator [Candidatus Micrarchaeota archaeon]|nr:CopG family transcriptional regulator [Candidatus Micrarchaeota archaeon]
MPRKTLETGRAGGYTTISIPAVLFDKIQARIEGTGFSSTSSFVTYVLRQLVSEGGKSQQSTNARKNAFTRDDEHNIRSRLRALGYQ